MLWRKCSALCQAAGPVMQKFMPVPVSGLQEAVLSGRTALSRLSLSGARAPLPREAARHCRPRPRQGAARRASAGDLHRSYAKSRSVQGRSVTESRQISEGGFAFVWLAKAQVYSLDSNSSCGHMCFRLGVLLRSTTPKPMRQVMIHIDMSSLQS